MGCPNFKPINLGEDDEENEEGNLNFNEIPKDEFICPNCNQVPQILKFHTDNSSIELFCKNDGIIMIKLRDYYDSVKKSNHTYFNITCNACATKITAAIDEQNMFKYCYYCQKDYCQRCFDNRTKHPNCQFDKHIFVNEKKNKCLKHFGEEVNKYCEDCDENVCNEESNSKHKEHKLIDLSTFNESYEMAKKKILSRNKELLNIINFNKLILKTGKRFNHNYSHIQSIINLGNSIDEEKIIVSKDLECYLKQMDDIIKISKDKKNKLFQNKKIYLMRNEQFLHLTNRLLDNNDFKIISQIKFNQLTEINISENNISDIEPLRNMNLPFLEYLNMSYNKIVNIEPIAELNCPQLKEIFLHYNKITDLNPFFITQKDFPQLKILRVEENSLDENSESFKNVIKKFKQQIIFKKKNLEEFNDKYNLKIPDDYKHIYLRDKKKFPELIKDFYILITDQPTNEINSLKFINSNIIEPSYLTRIPLIYLQVLDLTMNKLKNLKFLEKMKLTSLTELYLNDNNINEISPLVKIDANELGLITLYNNNFLINEIENSSTINELKKKYERIEIQLDPVKK